MSSEYSEQLRQFARLVNGTFNYTSQPTKTLRGMGWSRAEIRIPNAGNDIYYIAFSGANSAEVHSGFYAEGNLSSTLFCRITERDGFSRLVNAFSSYTMRSGNPEFDKKLYTACNNKNFLLKLSASHEASRFLRTAVRRPIRFEVMTNEKGILQGRSSSAMVISLNTNEWITDKAKLIELLDGFRILVNHIG